MCKKRISGCSSKVAKLKYRFSFFYQFAQSFYTEICRFRGNTKRMLRWKVSSVSATGKWVYWDVTHEENIIRFIIKLFFLLKILASSAKNLVILNFGLIISFSTILIPALTGLNSKNNPNETLRITPEESTWLGKKNTFYSKTIINMRNLYSKYNGDLSATW